MRSDPGIQQAFGRNRCAEQSVIQETLNAISAQNVEQMEAAMNEIYPEIGLVTASASEYCKSVVRIAVRCCKNNGQWGIGVLITNLKPNEVADLVGIEPEILNDPLQLLLAYAWCYDPRGGAVETSFKQDNQALGMKKRNKKRFESQQMVAQLNALAHNVLV